MGTEQKEDGMELSLSLSLAMGSLRPQITHKHKSPNWNHLLFHSPPEIGKNDTGVRPRGIDVNRSPPPPPAVGNADDDAGVSSPKSTVSSISAKRGEREETEAERASSSPALFVVDGEDDGGGDGGGEEAVKKKLRLTKEQAAVLEDTFKEHNTLNARQKSALAKQLNLRARQVEVWFQNRRARFKDATGCRTKLKQTEVDCEYLRKCCYNLTEENRRLQKEVQQLRAIKLSPSSLYNCIHLPPTTLSMCPSCERLSLSSSSSSLSSPAAAAASADLTRRHHHHLAGPHHYSRPVPIRSWEPAPAPGMQRLLPLDAPGPRS
ncbi:homeobox-leucine zipper protein HAT4 isoform X2 [Malania oleifera]|uniref:homeobox-leucine zipper protein HAT4 isoform X2 n=1 Tax=Malania oleifera TaxID=397392 RepID=UPI0025ADFD62|nr:homeobox-leucine zipper protein HAT4 isoform X2 [Malania oleifera]